MKSHGSHYEISFFYYDFMPKIALFYVFFMLNDKTLCHFYAITTNHMSKYHREMKQTNKKMRHPYVENATPICPVWDTHLNAECNVVPFTPVAAFEIVYCKS